MPLSSDGYRSSTPGTLPADGSPVVAGVPLPPGSAVTPDAAFSAGKAPTTAPVLWIADQPVRNTVDLWTALQQRFAATGLWPIILDHLGNHPERPWDEGEFDPTTCSRPDEWDVDDVLRQWWEDSTSEEDGLAELAPFGKDFPGLAAEPDGYGDAATPRMIVDELTGRLGLVAVTRPADVLAAIGWQGPVNYYEDVALLSCVLRSWEDRYGAVLVGLGFDTMTVAVRRPPTDERGALALAAEHFAACPDLVWQGAGTLSEYAAMLYDAPMWAFWWD